jgi:hypothetical protein
MFWTSRFMSEASIEPSTAFASAVLWSRKWQATSFGKAQLVFFPPQNPASKSIIRGITPAALAG